MKNDSINYLGIFCLVVMIAIAMSICGSLLVSNSLTNNIAYAQVSSGLGVIEDNHFPSTYYLETSANNRNVLNRGWSNYTYSGFYIGGTFNYPTDLDTPHLLWAVNNVSYDNYSSSDYLTIKSNSSTFNADGCFIYFALKKGDYSYANKYIQFALGGVFNGGYIESGYFDSSLNWVVSHTGTIGNNYKSVYTSLSYNTIFANLDYIICGFRFSPFKSGSPSVSNFEHHISYISLRFPLDSTFRGFVLNDYSPNGYNDGYENGLEDGYDNGLEDGYDNGYESGYANGVVDGGIGSLVGYDVVSSLDSYGNEYMSDFYIDNQHYRGILSDSSSSSPYNMKALSYGGAYSSATEYLCGYYLGTSQFAFAINGWFCTKHYSFPTFNIVCIGRTNQEKYIYTSDEFSINKTYQYGSVEARYSLFGQYRHPTQDIYDCYIVIPSNYDLGGNVYISTLFYSNFSFYSYVGDVAQLDNPQYFNGYNDGYEQGLSDGFDEGYVDVVNREREAFDNGYNQGKQVGLNEGYTNGFRHAVDTHSNYSFLSLFSAVIDAPVQVVSDMFDFELLGFNLKAFFYSMITLALIIFIIKLFI